VYVEMSRIEVKKDALVEEVEDPIILGIGDDDELVEEERTSKTSESSGYGSDILVDEGDAFEGRMVVEVENKALDLGDVEGCCYSF